MRQECILKDFAKNYKAMPRYYTAEEYTDMLIIYGMAGENALVATRLYTERFPERERHPQDSVIFQCVQRARERQDFFVHNDTLVYQCIA